jgi:aminopeptidase 2
VILETLFDKFDEIEKRLPASVGMFSQMVNIMTSGSCRREQLERIESFFASRDTSSYNQVLAQSLDMIRTKIAWLVRDREDVAVWLKENGYCT